MPVGLGELLPVGLGELLPVWIGELLLAWLGKLLAKFGRGRGGTHSSGEWKLLPKFGLVSCCRSLGGEVCEGLGDGSRYGLVSCCR